MTGPITIAPDRAVCAVCHARCWENNPTCPGQRLRTAAAAEDRCRAAREEAAPLLRGERDGWVDLPCGGSVLIEGGRPVRLSDRGKLSINGKRVRWEAEQVTGKIILDGPWCQARGSYEYTSHVEDAEDQ